MIPAIPQVANGVVSSRRSGSAVAAGAMPVAGQISVANSRKRKAEMLQDLGGPITVVEVEAIQIHAEQVTTRAAGGAAAPAWLGPALAAAIGPVIAPLNAAMASVLASISNMRVHKRNSQAIALMGGNPVLEAPVTETGAWGAPIPAALAPAGGIPAGIAALLGGVAPLPNTPLPAVLVPLLPSRDSQSARWEIAALSQWYNNTFGIVAAHGSNTRNQKLKDWFCGA